jgi:hypothetical protein
LTGKAPYKFESGFLQRRVAANSARNRQFESSSLLRRVSNELFRGDAGGGRFSGLRYSVGYDADPTIGNSRADSAPHMYARPDVRAGVARLAAHGLVLDAWCYHPQLTDVIALARAVPQATIVMCHVGAEKPASLRWGGAGLCQCSPSSAKTRN